MREPCVCCGTTSGKDRVRKMCNKCYNKWHYNENKQSYIKRANKWKEENPDEYRKIHREAIQRRRAKLTDEEKHKIYRRNWLRRTSKMTREEREKRRQRSSNYYYAHKGEPDFREQRRKAKQYRRAKEKGTIADLTEKQWQDILKSFNFRCAYCNKKLKNPTQDHVIPVKDNGAFTLHNIVPACLACNQKKGWGKPPNPVQPVLI